MPNEKNTDSTPSSPGASSADQNSFVSQVRKDEAGESRERHRKRKMTFHRDDATITIAPGSGRDYTFELLDNHNRRILYDPMYKITTNKEGEEFASPELARYFTFTVTIPQGGPDRDHIVEFFKRMQDATMTKIAQQVNFSVTQSGPQEYKFVPDLNIYDGVGIKESVHTAHDIEDKFNQLIGAIEKHLSKSGYNKKEMSGPGTGNTLG